MYSLIVYSIGFFLITLLFQYLLHRFRKNRNRGKGAIWAGRNAAIAICFMGIVFKDIKYMGAVMGFLVADGIGKKMGWQ